VNGVIKSALTAALLAAVSPPSFGYDAIPTDGAFHVDPPTVEVGRTLPLTVVYVVGASGLAEGGTVSFRTDRLTWDEPYLESGAVKLVTDTGASFEVGKRDQRHVGWQVTVKVTGAALVEGDRIEVTLGNAAARSHECTVQLFAEDAQVLPAFVDHAATGKPDNWYVSAHGLCPRVRVVAGLPHKLRVVVPSELSPGDDFSVRIAIMDAFHNPPREPYEGLLIIDLPDGLSGAAERRVTGEDGNSLDLTGLRAVKAGTYRLRVRSGDGLLSAESNPMWVRDATSERLLWGNLHAHTRYSDGEGTPASCYDYARNFGLLDFAAVCDHDLMPDRARNPGLTRERAWADIQAMAAARHEAERFVTFSGHEWTGVDGHHNIYYLSDGGHPLIMGHEYEPDPATDHIGEVYDLLRGRTDVLVIPHIQTIIADWDMQDPAFGPVAEIYSVHGFSVHPGQVKRGGVSFDDALARGLHLGAIADADTHMGMPGHDYPRDSMNFMVYSNGLAAVRTRRFSRDGLFDALRARSCYATTGTRILLEITADDRPMGSIYTSDDAPRFRGRVSGTAPIAEVRLYCDGEVLRTWSGTGRDMSFEGVGLAPTADERAYYVEVEQTDGEFAWSSPVWVRRHSLPDLRVVEAERDGRGVRVTVSNDGNVEARDVDVALFRGDAPAASTALRRANIDRSTSGLEIWTRRLGDGRATVFLRCRNGEFSGTCRWAGVERCLSMPSIKMHDFTAGDTGAEWSCNAGPSDAGFNLAFWFNPADSPRVLIGFEAPEGAAVYLGEERVPPEPMVVHLAPSDCTEVESVTLPLLRPGESHSFRFKSAPAHLVVMIDPADVIEELVEDNALPVAAP